MEQLFEKEIGWIEYKTCKGEEEEDNVKVLLQIKILHARARSTKPVTGDQRYVPGRRSTVAIFAYQVFQGSSA